MLKQHRLILYPLLSRIVFIRFRISHFFLPFDTFDCPAPGRSPSAASIRPGSEAGIYRDRNQTFFWPSFLIHIRNRQKPVFSTTTDFGIQKSERV